MKYDCAFGLVDECFGVIKRLVFDSGFKGCETIVAKNTRSYFLPVLEAVDAGRLGDVLHYPEDPPISIRRSDGMLIGRLGVEARPVYGVKLGDWPRGSVELLDNGAIVVRSSVGKITLAPLPSPDSSDGMLQLGDARWYLYLFTARRREAFELGVAPSTDKGISEIRPFTPFGALLVTSRRLGNGWSVVELRVYAQRRLARMFDSIVSFLTALMNGRLSGKGETIVLDAGFPIIRPYRAFIASNLWEALNGSHKLSFMALRGMDFALMIFGRKLVYPIMRDDDGDSEIKKLIEAIRKVNNGEMSVEDFVKNVLARGYEIGYMKLSNVTNPDLYSEILDDARQGIMGGSSDIVKAIVSSVSKPYVGFKPARLRVDYFSNMTEEAAYENVVKPLESSIARVLDEVARQVQRGYGLQKAVNAA
ncbi:hypothetical protein Pdsh_01320 [Pyrodictium delaneyi]|uniref:NurA domain-containing protein n=1 Tax=Pyrodictium delaneyi TaxID=1273541 RepID=A0A211YRA3_9CREN|nr:hypothetical protein Pdsh_01320 [Pyrodictium delaneyi]